MTDTAPSSPETLVARLPRLNTVSAKRALVDQLADNWILGHAESLVASTEATLRLRVLKAVAKNRSFFGRLIEALADRLRRPLANAMAAEATSDALFSLLSAPTFSKEAKGISHLVRAHLVATACQARLAFRLPPHPKLPALLKKDDVLTQTLLADTRVAYDVRVLILRTAPETAYFRLISHLLRVHDEAVWRLVTDSSSPLDLGERHRLIKEAAQLLTESGDLPLEERVGRLGLLAPSPPAEVVSTALIPAARALYDQASTPGRQLNVLRSLTSLTTRFPSATEEPSAFDRAVASSTRFAQLGVSEFFRIPVADLENPELVGWLASATARAQNLDRWLIGDLREFARITVALANGHPELFAMIAEDIPSTASLRTWVRDLLTEFGEMLSTVPISLEAARTLGLLVRKCGPAPEILVLLFDRLTSSTRTARDFWVEVLDAAGFGRDWQPLATQSREELATASDTMREQLARDAFAQGYARASTALEEKLKPLARAARMLSSTLSRLDHEGSSSQLAFNDISASLASFGAQPVGQVGAEEPFDPARHEDSTGTATPGQAVTVAGVGFVLERANEGTAYLSKILVRPVS